MKYSCIKNEYNFIITPSSCKSILYKDLSTWMEGDHYEIPNEYIINVIPPFGSEVQIPIKTKETNEIKSNILSQSNCFLDGIYCISTESCGVLYKRNFPIVCNIECRLANLIRKASATNDDSLWNISIRLNASLKAVYAHSFINNFEMANAELKILEKELDNLNCNC